MASARQRGITGWFATPPGPAFAPARDRGIYLLWIGLVWAGMLAGFLPDLGRYMAEKPTPPWILHVHGIVYFVWLALVTMQIALVEVRKPALHKRLGWWVIGLSVALVPLGLVAAMVDMARGARLSGYEPQFLGLEFQSLIIFPLLLWLGVAMRRDLAAHKRLMILMTVVFLDPGTARLFGLFIPGHPGGIFGWWLSFFWGNAVMVAAMIGWDRWHHSRIHPALIGGAVLLAAGEAAAVWLEFSPWWHDSAARLVTAWGWAG